MTPFIALFGYPVVAVILFRRMPLPQALIWTILLGYLFLPENISFDLPLLPPVDKETVPAAAAAVLCLTRQRAALRSRAGRMAGRLAETPRRKSPVFGALLLVVALSPLAIAYANDDWLRVGVKVLPAMTLKDGLSMAMAVALSLMPFMLGRRYLAGDEGQAALLKALVAGALIYSVFMLYENRFSPQLHRIVYGYHQHSFIQHVRDGYRPMVFLAHGLRVGIFVCMACLAAAALWRVSAGARAAVSGRRLRGGAPRGNGAAAERAGAEGAAAERAGAERAPPDGAPAEAAGARPRRPRPQATTPPLGWLLRLAWLSFILVLSRNTGATAIMILLLGIVLLAGIRLQMVIAAVLAATILVYPMLRGAGWVPVEQIVTIAARIDEDRASSLGYRLRNEDVLLDRANERPLLGWGRWGRNRVYDPKTGEDISVTDGAWVMTIGVTGWTGYLARFGLLTLPIILLALRRRRDLDAATAGLALVLVANLVDLIPNSSLVPLTWLIAGALAGRVEMLRARTAAEATTGTGTARRRGGAARDRDAAVPAPA